MTLKGLDTLGFAIACQGKLKKCLISDRFTFYCFPILGTGTSRWLYDPCLTRDFKGAGVSLAHIGGFGLLCCRGQSRFFGRPMWIVMPLSRLGHYRSWIVPTQLCSVFILVILSFSHSGLGSTQLFDHFFLLLLLINLMGATQDIATDGLL